MRSECDDSFLFSLVVCRAQVLSYLFSCKSTEADHQFCRAEASVRLGEVEATLYPSSGDREKAGLDVLSAGVGVVTKGLAALGAAALEIAVGEMGS